MKYHQLRLGLAAPKLERQDTCPIKRVSPRGWEVRLCGPRADEIFETFLAMRSNEIGPRADAEHALRIEANAIHFDEQLRKSNVY